MLLKACVRGSHGQKNIFYRFDSFLTNKILLKGVKRFFARTLRNVVSVNGR